MKKILHILLSVSFVFVSFVVNKAIAQSPHVHGVATMTLALENKTLEIQLESPAANLLGFEHKAKKPEEKKKVAQTEALLQSPETLFLFKGASCEPKESRLDLSGIIETAHSEHSDEHNHHDHVDDHSEASHDHEKHKHEEHKHAKHKHEEHKHGEHGHEEYSHKEHAHEKHNHEEQSKHEHDEHSNDEHNEITASYIFSCTKTDSLKAVSTSLFEYFPAIEKINAMWVTTTKQGSDVINAKSNSINLK